MTAAVVLGRLAPPAEPAFFSPREVAVAGPLLDQLLAQDSEPRVPVLALIDARLTAAETDGWHYDDMPTDTQAWRDILGFLDADARAAHGGRPFADLDPGRQAGLIQTVQDRADAGRPHLEPVDPLCLHGVLLPSLGLERDRIPRARLPAGLPQSRGKRPGTQRGRRP